MKLALFPLLSVLVLVAIAAAAPKEGQKAASKPASAPTTFAIDRTKYRIAYSADGNQHDPDDIAASPMAIAMAGQAGLIDRVVHFQYANHLGDNSDKMEASMIESVEGAAKRWGLPKDRVFNCQKDLDGAIAHLARCINQSSESDRLYLIAAGPMETVWRCIDASDKAKRRFCTVVSHSTWNEKHADTPEMKHTWDDVKKTGVETIDISDQNRNLNNPVGEWDWLKAGAADWQWLHERRKTKNFDVSDSGMMWFVLTGRGDQQGTPAKVKSLFESAKPASAPAKP
jgi:hypothetical protein